MRVLAIHPGASYSTADVYYGLTGALKRRGVDLIEYNLDARILMADRYLGWLYRQVKRAEPEAPRPSPPEVVRLAARDVLPVALDNHVDLILICSGMFLPLQTVRYLRRLAVPIGLILTESPYDDEPQRLFAAHADIVWTNERRSVEPLRLVQPHTHYLPHAYDPERHYPERGDPLTKHDVVFVGSYFRERVEQLAAVDWRGIRLGLYGQTADLLKMRSAAARSLRPYVAGGILDNRTTATIYRRSLIGLNLYRRSKDWAGREMIDAGEAESLNPRAYELAACGVAQVSDWRAELAEVLPGAVACPTPERPLGQVIADLLTDHHGRQAMAERALALVQGQTFDQRAGAMLEQFAAVSSRRPLALMR